MQAQARTDVTPIRPTVIFCRCGREAMPAPEGATKKTTFSCRRCTEKVAKTRPIPDCIPDGNDYLFIESVA